MRGLSQAGIRPEGRTKGPGNATASLASSSPNPISYKSLHRVLCAPCLCERLLAASGPRPVGRRGLLGASRGWGRGGTAQSETLGESRALATGGPPHKEAGKGGASSKPAIAALSPAAGLWEGQGCAPRGQRAAPTGGGTPRRGVRAQGQVRFSRHTQKPCSAVWALDWVGCGEDREEGHTSLKLKKGLLAEEAGAPPLPNTPRPKLFSQYLSRGSRGQESPEKEALLCGAKGRGVKALSPPNLKVQEITAFGVPRRKGR